MNNQPLNNHLANVSTHLTALADAKARVQLDATAQDADTVGSVLAAYRSQANLTWQGLADWLGIDLPSLADLAAELLPGIGGQEMGVDQMAELYGAHQERLLEAFEHGNECEMGGRGDSRHEKHSNSIKTNDPQKRTSDAMDAIAQLLKRLGIRQDDPWVLLTTDGVISPEHARIRIDDGGDLREIPLPMKNLPHWEKFSFNLIGVPPGQTIYGAWQVWADLSLDVRYMCIRYLESPLYVEYLASEAVEADAMIRGIYLPHKGVDRKMAWHGRDLLWEELQRGAPEGPRPGTDAATWLARFDEIGEKAARIEYYAQVPRGHGRYTWWDANILRTIRRRKHHK